LNPLEADLVGVSFSCGTNKACYIPLAHKNIKGLKKEDLSPDYAGIRPKIWMDDNPMPDFYISHEEDKGYPGWINLIGIESPGLTASIAIGNDVASWIS